MKRIIAATLAAVLVATTAPVAISNAEQTTTTVLNASISTQQAEAESIEKGETTTVSDDNGTTESVKLVNGSIVVSAVKSTKKTVKIAGEVNGYAVTKFNSSAFKNCKKATTLNLNDVAVTSLSKNQFKGAKKLKTVKINATKLTKKNINKKALKGFKGNKIVLTCKNKKQYNALVKQLKKSAGSNVKFVYKKA